MKIYNKDINEENLLLLFNKIKNKPIVYVDDSFLLKHVKSYLEQNVPCIDLINKNNLKNKKIKLLIKTVRAKVRKVYGLFHDTRIEKRDALLDDYEMNRDKDALVDILRLHLSTKERISYMEELYDKIFKVTGKPEKILDLGCGLNPLTYPWMDVKAEYYAVEFNQKDVEFINRFFKVEKIKGKAIKLDLLDDYKKIKSHAVDVCFLFKALDSLERVKRYISYEIIKNVNAKFIVVSFPLKTVTGKQMRLEQRNWFEKLLGRLDKQFQVFSFKNEIFYLIQ
ncbi:hypothetical protein KY337_00890 [Candidatus Woesearchaeota archaeon]|nr:hypothetical protein [Candidatus Woesearchaeota archaeon]